MINKHAWSTEAAVNRFKVNKQSLISGIDPDSADGADIIVNISSSACREIDLFNFNKVKLKKTRHTIEDDNTTINIGILTTCLKWN